MAEVELTDIDNFSIEPESITIKRENKWAILKSKIRTRAFALTCTFFFGYLITGVVATIYMKKYHNLLSNYPYFASQLSPPFTALYFAICIIGIFFRRKQLLTKETLQFPKYHYFFMSILDALSIIMQTVGSIGMGPTAGPLVVVVAQTLIPLTVLLSMPILKVAFLFVSSIPPILGLILILGGVLVNLSPSFSNFHTSSFLWTIVFFLSNFPGSLVAIYKEWAFGKSKVNICYLGFFENIFISLVGTALAPLYFALLKRPMKDMILEYRLGAMCVGGIDSTVGDSCHNGWILAIIFNFLSFTWILTGLGIVAYGSANLAFFSQALVLPICNLLFSSAAIMGENASHITVYDVLGIIIISAGVSIYALPFKIQWPCFKKPSKIEGESLLSEK